LSAMEKSTMQYAINKCFTKCSSNRILLLDFKIK
jgi:hypothetical protein